MRSGCVSYILRIGTAVVAAVLLAAGAFVLIFGAFNLDSSGGVGTLLTVVLALAAIFLFIRVGKDILRDLRKENPGNKETPPE